MENKKLKIWILDSGMWGYYALLDIKSHFPQYQYETYLDSENAPYGNKSGEEIFRLSEAGCQDLWNRWCDLILIACNTICAETLRRLQDRYSLNPPLNSPLWNQRREEIINSSPPFVWKGEMSEVHNFGQGQRGIMNKKILGCIIPSVEVAVEISPKRIGLIATQFTIDSRKYEREIAKLSPSHELISVATPELAGFIEQGMQDHKFTQDYLERRVQKLIDADIDTIILGCTHYTVFYEYLSAKYPHLHIVDSAKTQTIKLGEYLQNHPELFK